MSSAEQAEAGFTLVEMMVALAVLSLAALALLRLNGALAANGARLAAQADAQIVARNIAVETLTDPVPPTIGRAGGVLVNAGRRWTWSRVTGPSPEPRIHMIQVTVREGEDRAFAALTVFRRAGR